jgi:hypothetical protein
LRTFALMATNVRVPLFTWLHWHLSWQHLHLTAPYLVED